MNSYQCSDGSRLTKAEIDRKVAQAKTKYSMKFEEEFGYIFCERCFGNQSQCPGIARSHIISVKEAQESGRSELSHDLENLEHLGQKCHREFEELASEIREGWYHARKKNLTFKQYQHEFTKTHF